MIIKDIIDQVQRRLRLYCVVVALPTMPGWTPLLPGVALLYDIHPTPYAPPSENIVFTCFKEPEKGRIRAHLHTDPPSDITDHRQMNGHDPLS